MSCCRRTRNRHGLSSRRGWGRRNRRPLIFFARDMGIAPLSMIHSRYISSSFLSTDFFCPLSFFLSTDYHRLSQIFLSTEFFCPQIYTDYHRFLNIKDILIITDFLFGTEIHGFIFNKGTAWLLMDITTALRDYGLLRKFTA